MTRPRWLPGAIGVGILYLVIGLATAELAGGAASIPARNRWRLAAWVISAIVFAAQVARERLRLGLAARAAAGHAAAAAAIGAFGLAAAATIHKSIEGGVDGRYAVALVAWPLVIAIPAFMAAYLLSLVLRPTAPPAD